MQQKTRMPVLIININSINNMLETTQLFERHYHTFVRRNVMVDDDCAGSNKQRL